MQSVGTRGAYLHESAGTKIEQCLTLSELVVVLLSLITHPVGFSYMVSSIASRYFHFIKIYVLGVWISKVFRVKARVKESCLSYGWCTKMLDLKNTLVINL